MRLLRGSYLTNDPTFPKWVPNTQACQASQGGIETSVNQVMDSYCGT